jgi:hypothetical protein
MDDRDQEARTKIAEESVGERRERPPGTARNETGISPEETMRRNAVSPGPQASTPEKTAQSLGERVGDAYADPGRARPQGWQPGSRAHGPDPVLGPVGEAVQTLSRQFEEQPLMLAMACFALGYMTALWLHGRRSI